MENEQPMSRAEIIKSIDGCVDACLPGVPFSIPGVGSLKEVVLHYDATEKNYYYSVGKTNNATIWRTTNGWLTMRFKTIGGAKRNMKKWIASNWVTVINSRSDWNNLV